MQEDFSKTFSPWGGGAAGGTEVETTKPLNYGLVLALKRTQKFNTIGDWRGGSELRPLVVLLKEQDSIPSTHMAIYNCL